MISCMWEAFVQRARLYRPARIDKISTGTFPAAVFAPQETFMTDKITQEQSRNSNMEKDPDDWTTGDEEMTGAQRSYLKTLSEEAKVPFDETLTKAEASKRIDELQHKTGRGLKDQNANNDQSAGNAQR